MRWWIVVGVVCAVDAIRRRCPEELIDCQTFIKRCIQKADICDGVEDCASGFDERFCACRSDGDCRTDEKCVWQGTSKQCAKYVACKPGYLAMSESCVDIDECAGRTHNCTGTEFCLNTEGSFECKCKGGYHYNVTQKGCVDIDECSSGHYCEPPAHCTNSVGSFNCTCPQNYFTLKHIVERPDGSTYEKFKCDRNNTCEQHESCLSSAKHSSSPFCTDGISCRCPEGYEFRGATSSCEDVDECALKIHDCAAQLMCRNTIGGFSCTCPEGFRCAPGSKHQISGVSNTFNCLHCEDINECEENLHSCQFNCTNIPGSFNCDCKEGYVPDIYRKICLPARTTFDMIIAEEGEFLMSTINVSEDSLQFTAYPNECNVSTSKIFTFVESRRELYFVNAERNSILQMKMLGPCYKVITGRENITAVEIDWVYGNLYWADSNGLNVARDNGWHSTLFLPFEEYVSKIIVNPLNGWLTFLSNEKAWRIGLDGSFRHEIFDNAEVIALAFDAEDVQIVVQTKNDIKVCQDNATSLDTCRSLAVSDPNSFLLDAFGDFTLVEVQGSEFARIIVVAKESKARLQLKTSLTHVSGRIVHEIKQPIGKSKCSSPCSGLCLNSPSEPRFRCLCADDNVENCVESTAPRKKSSLQGFRATQGSFATLSCIVVAIVGTACGAYGMVVQWLYRRKPRSMEYVVTETPYVEMSHIDFQRSDSRKKLVDHEVEPAVVGLATNVTHPSRRGVVSR